MKKPLIEVKNISKKYNITHERGGYIALRDVLTNIIKNPFIFLRAKTRQVIGLEKKEEFWALKNINFSVKKGEIVGIIGSNGAGKSTLLKILSQITPPTEGEITIRGRVGSLLEVGTGFHPELTGRENIFLNGAILGMTKKEIVKKFDAIVKFAGIEKFLDTPAKRYSSGMYVRLAFSVAAHMEPDILIVDEVLAVGDAEFQKKCLGKMEEVAKKDGRTIIFVSHNMGAIARLCNRTILLKNGEIAFSGKTDEVISTYLDKLNTQAQIFERDRKTLRSDNQFISVHNSDAIHQIKNDFRYDEEIRVMLEVFLPKWNDSLEIGLFPCDKLGKRIFMIEIPLKKYYSGDSFLKFEVLIPAQFLMVGNYSWTAFIHNPLVSLYDYQESICHFSINETGSYFLRYNGFDNGCVYPPKYSVKKLV